MALRFKIDKAAYDKLPDDIKKEYKADGDGFKLDVDEQEIAGEALNARDNMKKERDEAKKAADEAAKKLADETARAEKAEKDAKSANEKIGKDIQELDAKYKERIETAEKQRDEANAKFDNFQIDAHKKTVVDRLAGEISTSPSLIAQVIAPRISVELVDGKPIERVLDADGKPSAQSLNDLRKEIVDNKEYAPIIKVSDAKGGGAPESKGGGGAPQDTPNNQQQQDVSRLSTADLRARVASRVPSNNEG
jgi:hypothetical protein